MHILVHNLLMFLPVFSPLWQISPSIVVPELHPSLPSTLIVQQTLSLGAFSCFFRQFFICSTLGHWLLLFSLKQWLLLQKIKWSLWTYYTQLSPPKCQCFRSFPHLLIYKKASVNFHNFTLIFFSSTHTHVTVLRSLLNIPTLIFLLYKTYTNTHPILCSWE